MPIDESTPLNYLYKYAKYSYKNCYSQEKFIVQNLFKKFEWNRINKTVKANLGLKFLRYAENLGANKIEIIPKKTKEKQQVYKKL